LAKRLLEDWAGSLKHFVKVLPLEYKRILEKKSVGKEQSVSIPVLERAATAAEVAR
jgi:glutamate synthase domain-containing protein 3